MLPLRLVNRIGTFIFVLHFLLLIGVDEHTKAQERVQKTKTKPISAVGLVIDEASNPVEGATVSFDVPRYGGGDVFPSFRTGREGVFQIDDSVRGTYAWLVIQQNVPGFARVAVDYLDLKEFPEFRGLRLKAPKNPKFIYQLGYVKPHIVYRKVELDLTNLFMGNFVKENYELKYSIEYKNNLVSDNIYVDSRDFNQDTKKLVWAMPTGCWKVIFSLESGGQKRVADFSLSLR